jgi:DNA (cytosine-5)-methyltransferase 1
MASLFDGISGFSLLWTKLNGWGSVLWTSEIEEFPIAVCKRHFGDEATGEKGDFYEAILGRNSKGDV